MKVLGDLELKKAVRSLRDWQRSAFMACCCERMIASYVQFHEETGFGEPSVLRRTLDAIWTRIASDVASIDREALARLCDEQAPETEQFSSVYTSAALDAANAISITAETMGSATAEHLGEVASLARDSVDLFIQQSASRCAADSDLEDRILSSPLMQAELRSQAESLRIIGASASDRQSVVDELRQDWSSSSLGLVANPSASR